MSRRLVPVTGDNVGELPSSCRACVFWELDPAAADRACSTGSTQVEKQAWLSDTLRQWGSCGLLAQVDGRTVGYVLFAPAAYVPRALSFATSPVSPDAVLLMTGWLDPSVRGAGLGRLLLQGVARDVVRRGTRAVEAFGRTGGTDGCAGTRGEPGCLLPVEYLLAVGFTTVRAHQRTPRLRLDIRSTLTWREDVESAWDRLVSSIQSPAPLRH